MRSTDSERVRSSLNAYLALGLAVLSLGFSAIFTRWANAPGIVTSLYRMAIAVILLAGPFARRVGSGRTVLRPGIRFAILGGLLLAGDFALWATGVMLSGATNPTLLANTAPLWVGLGAVILFRERLGLMFWAGLLPAMAGAVLVVGLDALRGAAFGLGSLLGLLAAVFYGGYFLANQRGRETLDSLSYFWLSTTSCGAVLLLLALMFRLPLVGYSIVTYANFLAAAPSRRTGKRAGPGRGRTPGEPVCTGRGGCSMRGSWMIVAVLTLAAAIALPGAGRDATAQGDPAGSQPRTMSFGGRQRTYRIYVPTGGAGPMPLLLALHGGGGTGAAMERLTQGGFNRLADRERFVVVYPDGVDRHWNDGRGVQAYRAHREDINDVGFIAALIGHVAQSVPIDERRVYATGISNGGLMSFRLARELADRIAAIAPVAISMSEQLAQMRGPTRPVSVLLMPGTNDPLVPWAGGDIGFAGRQKVGRVISVPETIRTWVAHNQCPSPATVTWEADRDPQDGTRVRREAYGPCRDGTEVVLYAIEGGGHTWPGGQQYLPERIVGRTSRDIDANEVIWNFLRRHTMR